MKRPFFIGFTLTGSILLLSLAFNAQKMIKGNVLADSLSVAFARVRVKAADEYILTDFEGNFEMAVPDDFDSLVINAWAPGFFNGETKLYPEDTAVIIHLHPLYEVDNPEYEWLSPFADSLNPMNCGNCHADVLMGQWSKNAHANSARNPFFLAMYYGKDTALVEDCGVGYKKDFTETRGNCATCHIPGAAVHDPWGIDPSSVTGMNENGVFCDVCHKIKDVYLTAGQGTTGILSIAFLRPPAGKQVFFGPYDDIHEPDAYLPLIGKSQFCAACHTGRFWGTEAYNSFNEWKNSPYPAKGIECQTCHMYPDSVTTHFVRPERGGLERNPLRIPSHLQPGSRDQRILANSLTMNISVVQRADSIVAMVTLFNDQTGHHVPTDRPSRNMILLVDAIGENGEKLEFIGGEKVPWWGGTGEVGEGNYHGLPGKGYAKILEDFEGNAPAPSWRPSHILSDNRIAAFDTDTSYYYFKAPPTASLIKISSKLIYRRFFKETMKEKGFEIDDIIMESDSVGFTTESMTSVYQYDEIKDFSLGAFPNPFSNTIRLNVHFYHSNNTAKVEIFNITGKIMERSALESKADQAGSAVLDFTGFQPGCYFCRVSTMKYSETIRLIKE